MTDTVASLLVETLIANGMTALYCVPGVQNDDFFDALHPRQNALKPIQARHEQGAAYMALGAALATGRPQAFAVVPGPGFLNATAALATALTRGVPLAAIVGQIPIGAIGKGRGQLHEIPDQLAILKGLTKQAERVTGGDMAVAAVQRMLAGLTGGRPQPVGLEIPVDVWKKPVSGAPASLLAPMPDRPGVDAGQIEEAAKLIGKCERPMIVVGGGAQDLGAQVAQLAEAISAPVSMYRAGRGVISDRHELAIGVPVAHALWQDVDLVIGLGSRLQTHKGWGIDGNIKIVHIDIDADELQRTAPADVGIRARLEDALPKLLSAVAAKASPRKNWCAEAARAKAEFAREYAEKLAPQMAHLAAIRQALPEDGILVDELTQVGYVSRFAFPVYRPRTFISTGYQGTLGWGIATALGAQHARPDVPVVSIAGDGGALFTITELATAALHDIPLTAVIFKDNAFGNVRRFQIENYEGRTIASDLRSPDFVKLAESFGIAGVRATTPAELQQCLTAAFKARRPTVVEVPVGDFPSPWKYLMLSKVR